MDREQIRSNIETISVPYCCTAKEITSPDEVRRIYSAAVRAACANARPADGAPFRQKELRDLVEASFAHLKFAEACP